MGEPAYDAIVERVNDVMEEAHGKNEPWTRVECAVLHLLAVDLYDNPDSWRALLDATA